MPDTPDVTAAVEKLTADGLDRKAAEILMRRAKERGEDLDRWSDYLVDQRTCLLSWRVAS